ncbi:MAG: protein kinase [Myxococcota bacterium]
MTDLLVVFELSRLHAPADPYAFTFEPQSYTLRTEGGGRSILEIDWSPELLADLRQMRRPDRDPAVVQRVGESMARFLERASWPERAGAIARAHDAGRRVLVTIRSNAAELYALPWELLTVPGRGQHLGSLPGVLLRYERPETRTTPETPAPRPEGGRILLAWSAAGGAVPAAAHEAALRRACTRGHPEGEDALQVLPHASLAAIGDALGRAEQAGRPFAALHVLCHGGRTGQTFGLVLNDEVRRATVAAQPWRTLLGRFAGSLRLVLLAACDGGNAGEPGNYLGSVAQAIHAAGVEAVVASRNPLSTVGSTTLTETLYEGLLGELESLEQALLRVRMRLALDPVHLDWAAVLLYARAEDGGDTRPFVFRPYRGLLAFEAAQGAFFFGRQVERARILAQLDALIEAGKPRLLVVAGASGTGKSSLVRSGAVPDILARPGGAWPHAIIRPGGDPMGALAGALAKHDPERPLLLVVDQFEELFTHTEDREIRCAFARRLWALAREPGGPCCILALRVDFMGRCGELRLDDAGTRLDTVAYDEAHRVFVAQMDAAQLLDAIVRPAQRAGLTLQDGLAERIVAEVGMEPGALPLMQYTLDRLWQARRGRALTADVYEELGGVVGSLERRANELLQSLDDDQLRYARRMLTQLVGLGDDDTGDTRYRVPIEQLWPTDSHEREDAEAVLGRLVDERLVVRDDRTRGGATVELAHEALIRHWERLREWLHDERKRRIGRYVVLERFRETSTQEAFLGYDPDLDRRVAIKVLLVGRHGAEKRARLREQARAHAHISHPNTVAVYDVGVTRGHVYMAMEMVEGVLLRTWLHEQPRSWVEIVDVFAGAAEGLAAAHRLGLLHLAFYPNAVLVDAEGVARVIDFSLCQQATLSNAGRSASTIAARLHARGGLGAGRVDQSGAARPDPSVPTTCAEASAMVDSAYMPPERMRGLALGPASDQFGFCVSLYEVVFGERPFEDHSMAAFVRAPSSRTRSRLAGRSRGLERLRKVLLRGLSAEPDARWPSMEALAAELRRTTAPRRWRGWIVGLSIAALGLGAVGKSLAWRTLTRHKEFQQQCFEDAAALDQVWEPARRTAIRDAMLATQRRHATQTWERIESRLDEYAEAWSAKYTEVCEATGVWQRQSPEVMAMRMACLEQRRSALHAVVDVLAQSDLAREERAMSLVTSLPGLARCDDLVALASEWSAPDSSEAAAQLRALRQRLVFAAALREAADYDRGEAVAREVAQQAEALGNEPLLAEALEVQGSVHARAGDNELAEQALERSYLLGLEHGHHRVQRDAASELISVVGLAGARFEWGEKWAQMAQALASRPPTSERAQAVVALRIAALRSRRGELDEASSHYQRALELLEHSTDPRPLEVADALIGRSDVLRRQGATSEAIEGYARALEIREELLGAEHPQAASARFALARASGGELDDRARARALVRQSRDDLAALGSAYADERREIEAWLAAHGEPDVATTHE